MSRLVRGAIILADQVCDLREKATVETVGEADGLDLYRQIKFDKATSKWLEPLLEEIDDARVESLDTEDGHLVVTFVGANLADFPGRYPLEDAETVAGE